MKPSLFILLLMFPIRLAAVPQDSLVWTYCGGPPGGLGYDIRYNFSNPDIWYVTDNFCGVFRSEDNGLTWQQSNTGIPPQSGPTGDAVPIFSLTVDSHNPQILWAGTNPTGHIYRSTDGGLTWERRDNGVTIDYEGGLTFRGFTVDPTSSDIVYAMGETSDPAIGFAVWGPGTGGAVYKTINAGASWSKIWDGGVPSSLTRYMCIDPRDPQVLFVSTGIFDRGAIGEPDDPEESPYPFGGLGILKSTDGGQTWDTLGVANGLNFLYIGSIFMHPDNPDLLLAAAGHITPGAAVDQMDLDDYTPMGIYRTIDGGETWTQVYEPKDNPGECFTAVEIHPTYGNIAYAGSDGAIYMSRDTGATWIHMSAGTKTWGPPGIVAGWPIDLQCDPRDSLRLFANNYNGGNFLSEDGGHTWRNASLGYTGCQARSVSVDPFNPARIFEAGRSGIWKSNDAGHTWEGVFYPDINSTDIIGLEWMTMVCDPRHFDQVLAGKNIIIRTLNGGGSWTRVWQVQTVQSLLPPETPNQILATFAFPQSDENRIYAALCSEGLMMGHERGDISVALAGGGVLRSTDNGVTWERAVDANLGDISVFDLALHPANALLVYAATTAGLFKTTDGGDSWTLMTTPSDTSLIRAVALDPGDPDHLLIALEGSGIHVTLDGGQNWQAGYAGLEPNGSIHDIVFDPTNGNIAYTSDYYSGIYRSEDGGFTWAVINQGLLNRSAMSLSISSDGQHLYATTDGAGVFRLDLNGIPAKVEDESRPRTFQLSQNYPNPFNPSTTISYRLTSPARVRLEILDLRGRLLRILVDRGEQAGSHTIIWYGRDGSGNEVPSGVYICRLKSAGSSAIRKMTLIR